MPVIVVDFESYHPDPQALKRERAARYWEHLGAQANCMVACCWVPAEGAGDDAGRMTIAVWTRTEHTGTTPTVGPALRDLLPLHTQAHLQRFSSKPPVIKFFHGPECPAPLRLAIENGIPLVAHNAQFDARAWRRLGWPEPSAWYDTMHLSRAALGTGKLDEALKRMYGEGKVDVPTSFPKWETLSNGGRVQLLRYCASDTIPAASLMIDLADRLQPWELQHSAVDFRMNDRGLPVDRTFAQGLAAAAEAINLRAAEETAAAVASVDGPGKTINLKSPKQLIAWCAAHGLLLADVQQRTLESVIDDEDQYEWYRWMTDDQIVPFWFRKRPEDAATTADWEQWPEAFPVTPLPADELERGRIVRAVLRVLQARVGSISIVGGKAQAALRELCNDGRLRDQIQHRKAHTGRSAGQGLQPQNLPRGVSRCGPDAEEGADLSAALDEIRELLIEAGA